MKPQDGAKAPLALAPTELAQRVLDASFAITQREPGSNEIGFHHSTFCQIGLPYKDPGEQRLWKRKQGRAYLYVQSKLEVDDAGNEINHGLPFGEKARLVLMHFNSEAVRNQSPVIDVEDSMTRFVRFMLDRKPNQRELKAVRDQLGRLASAIVSISGSDGGRRVVHDTQIVDTLELWYPPEPEQRVLWQSRVRLSESYFRDLMTHAVPLDQRAVRTLSNTALGLDLYTWLAQRLHRIPDGSAAFVPWGGPNSLHEQFGYGYAQVRQFRAFFLKLLSRVHSVYPGAHVTADHRGLTLEHSPPPVAKKLTQRPALPS